MTTFLFDKIIFGPVSSRRLGISLGINVLPTKFKLCNFDCLYCECGFTPKNLKEGKDFYSREEIREALEMRLSTSNANSEPLDSITFAGNGEPTIHPDFPGIIDDTIELRDKYFPGTKISVLSNSSMTGEDKVVNALKKIENVILKLDSGIERTIKLLNRPLYDFDLDDLVKNLKKFENKIIIQSLFLKGQVKGDEVDNTTEEEINKYLKLIEIIQPSLVMVYTYSRSTPASNLETASVEKLEEIAERIRRLGIQAEVYI